MGKISELREKAKQDKKRIILPEGEDERVVRAASFIAREGIANICVLGNAEDIKAKAEACGLSLEGVEVIDPLIDGSREKVIEKYYELRKHKGMTLEEAEKLLMEKKVFYAATMAKLELADGYVAGAVHTTGDVARSAIQCIGIDREIGTVSSSFLMEIEDCPFGYDGLFVFADCAVIPYPTSKQLAGIALASSELFQKLFPEPARVAMLSFSTKGSAEGDSINTVREAMKKIIERKPDLLVDGELQLDSALIPEIAAKKCGQSEVAGKANVLVFPNLDAGNIGYKLTERLGKARAVGPIFQGIQKPCSDLSRGCSWEDIVDVVSVTAVRARQT
jgi:phosphate acetyltransferase